MIADTSKSISFCRVDRTLSGGSTPAQAIPTMLGVLGSSIPSLPILPKGSNTVDTLGMVDARQAAWALVCKGTVSKGFCRQVILESEMGEREGRRGREKRRAPPT
jgi:hypothetical protein